MLGSLASNSEVEDRGSHTEQGPESWQDDLSHSLSTESSGGFYKYGYTWQEESLWKVQETESQLGQLLGAVMGFDTAWVIYLDECRRLQPLLWVWQM